MIDDYKFRFPIRVRVHECDVQGVLYHGRYVQYLDTGIVEYWRAAGRYHTIDAQADTNFHIVKVEVEYLKAILLDEEINVCTRCSGVGTSSIHFEIELHGHGHADLRARGKVIHVQVDGHLGRAVPVLDQNLALLERFEGTHLKRIDRAPTDDQGNEGLPSTGQVRNTSSAFMSSMAQVIRRIISRV